MAILIPCQYIYLSFSQLCIEGFANGVGIDNHMASLLSHDTAISTVFMILQMLDLYEKLPFFSPLFTSLCTIFSFCHGKKWTYIQELLFPVHF